MLDRRRTIVESRSSSSEIHAIKVSIFSVLIYPWTGLEIGLLSSLRSESTRRNDPRGHFYSNVFARSLLSSSEIFSELPRSFLFCASLFAHRTFFRLLEDFIRGAKTYCLTQMFNLKMAVASPEFVI